MNVLRRDRPTGRIATASAAIVAAWTTVCAGPAAAAEPAEARPIRVGVIGLDTGHATAFTKFLNDAADAEHVPGARVVAAYPRGSDDIPSSVSRVPAHTEVMKGLGVEIVDSIEALLPTCDAVLLESNDGRVHLRQAVPVLAAGKPVFIDKPLAGSLADAVAIFRLAKHHGTPVFSSSALRFGAATQAVRGGSLGEVVGCDAYSPCPLEPTHPDLFWYGIHGCESLFTVMGTGCETVARTSGDGVDLVTGRWSGGRLGTFRGIRRGKGGYGGTAFGTKGVAPAGGFDGYRPLVVAIVEFFRTREPPVAGAETIELYAFMEAAHESTRRGGQPVAIKDVLEPAEREAAAKVEQILAGAAPREAGGAPP